jgi:hypothetical protein
MALLIGASHKNQNSMAYPKALNAPEPTGAPSAGGCLRRPLDIQAIDVHAINFSPTLEANRPACPN